MLRNDKPSEDMGQELRWFWLNTGDYAQLGKWFEAESLLEDVGRVEESMARWFNQNLSGVKLPVNHFHLTERPDPTVQFLDQILNDAPAFLGYTASIPPESCEVLLQIISHWYTCLEANPQGGHAHTLIKPAMLPYIYTHSALHVYASYVCACLAGMLVLGCWRRALRAM